MSGCVIKRCEWGAVSVLRVKKTRCDSVAALKRMVVWVLLLLIALCASTVDESEKERKNT